MDLPNEIEALLKKLKYTPLQILRVPDGGNIRSWVVLLESQRSKKKFILKHFWLGSRNSHERFLRELIFLRNRSLFSIRLKTHVLPLIKSSFGGEKEKPWMIFRFYEGEPLAKFIEDLGIPVGKFSIPSYEQFVHFMLSIWDLNKLKIKSLKFKVGGYDYEHVIAEIKHYKKHNLNLFSPKLWENLEKFLGNNQTRVFKHLKLSHRDLYPENFLFRNKYSFHFKLIDWEYLSLVPVAWDSAFFGLLFWRERIWRDRFYGLSLSRYKGLESDFNISYRFCTVLLSLRFLYQLKTYARGDKDYEFQREYYVTFLKDRLRSALSGSLVKPIDPRFMISGRVINKILKYYSLGEFKSYELYHLSKGNTVFKVKIGNPKSHSYVFRIYNQERPLSQVKRELAIFNQLSQKGIPTYTVVKNRKSGFLTNVNFYGMVRRVAVFTYLRGGSPNRHQIGAEVVFEAGKMLFKIHTLKITHGDYSKRNVLFYKDKVSGVIDLEYGKSKAGKKSIHEDLAKSVCLWCMSVTLKNINVKDRVIFFLKGYWGNKYSEKKVKKIIPIILKALDKEEEIHHKIYGGEGEGYGVIREELNKLK